jgi:1-deoxy-D-xylulose-5-phosphate reductoisomerase
MKKTLSILGSTGSIGLSALSIIKKKKNLFKINFLSANKNYHLICKQIIEYKPKFIIVRNELVYNKIKKKFYKDKTKILNNFKLKNLIKTDITISAIPGIEGLEPTLNAIKLSKKILIANKESIICGWNLIKNESLKNNTQIVPIDSEHFSILKLLEKEKANEIKKIYITASGGPFLKFKKKQFSKIKPNDAFKHPKWKMGKKISVDSSTLMNKMLELVEAQKLFNIPDKKLDILIHPESLVHAIIEFNNGLIKFIYHDTSMIIPIANAIFEKDLNIEKFYTIKKNNAKRINNLSFEKVNSKTFPVIKLKTKINEFPSSAIIFNAANEILVDQFLRKKLPFLDISKTIMRIQSDSNYKKYAIKKPKNINEIIKIDKWTRKIILKKLRIND